MKEFLRFLIQEKKQRGRKITDRELIIKVSISVLIILFCGAMMSLSAFAYFTHNRTTQVGAIQAASYKVEITSDDGLIPNESNAYFLDNLASEEEKIFTFVVEKTADSTASVGYCKIIVATDLANPQSEDGFYHYYTKPIGTYLKNQAQTTVDQRTVYIRVMPKKSATVTFYGEWGSTAKEPLEEKKYIWPGYMEPAPEEAPEQQEVPPAEEPSAEPPAESNPPAEPPAEEPVVESPAESAPPAEEPVVETPAESAPPAEEPVVETPEESIPPAEEQPAEPPAEEQKIEDPSLDPQE